MNEEAIKSVAYKLHENENRKIACPACVDAGKSKHDLSMSVVNKGDHALYKCHRDDSHNGRINFENHRKPALPAEKPVTKIDPSEKELTLGQKWIEEVRGIPFSRVEQFVSFGSAYFKTANGSLPCVEFVYKNEQGKRVYSKFRSIEGKHFTSGTSSPGGTDTLYLTEGIDYQKKYLVVTEGETDALTLRAAGFNAVSMPTGANVKWLPHNQNLLSKFERVFIWFDADAKGGTVAERLKLQPPALTKSFFYLNPKKLTELAPNSKDANEVLLAHGTGLFKQILSTCFEKHTPDYVIKPSSLMPSLIRVRNQTYANRIGIGEPALDNIMSFTPGYAGIVTGIPGMGKTSFLSWYVYRRADKYGHKTVFWSPENDPALLSADLVGIAAGRVIQGHAGAAEMTDREIETNLDFIDSHFRIVQDSEEGSDIDTILNQMQAAALDMGGADIFVLDPFNFVKLPETKNQLDAVKIVFGKIRRFAVTNKCFFVLVAHPRKQNEKERTKINIDDSDFQQSDSAVKQYTMPGMYSISGSADFANMADLIVTVHREENHTIISTSKSRRPFLGSPGSCSVVFQPNSGRFKVIGAGQSALSLHDIPSPPF